jgi:hypothetical protein
MSRLIEYGLLPSSGFRSPGAREKMHRNRIWSVPYLHPNPSPIPIPHVAWNSLGSIPRCQCTRTSVNQIITTDAGSTSLA